ncbi:uncharacterized protein BP01DRAFT_359981 [Aspergillus saccharolyticus JOP 1030-1]|uniref:Uncharacterized protein n=1 Tax=Aspergillus saccharolyticus JOP 1030-1 TaxID=1450539 RepID=A0A318Z4E8_9EURO|nr:hypothetical protein BP01DRAFT_359981 [Aspergillus saccharolyticus JOP 1030-1]PYH41889.1 hypothetical protein BP01DRAFT_359981 [Aspergillus saccharolyticus JOP 1030-1]
MSNIMNPIDDPSYNINATEQSFGTDNMEPGHGAGSWRHVGAGHSPYSKNSQPMTTAGSQSLNLGDDFHHMGDDNNKFNGLGTTTAQPAGREVPDPSFESPAATLDTGLAPYSNNSHSTGTVNFQPGKFDGDNHYVLGNGLRKDTPGESARHSAVSSSNATNSGTTQPAPMDTAITSSPHLEHTPESTHTPDVWMSRGSTQTAQYNKIPSEELGRGRQTSDRLSPSKEHDFGHTSERADIPSQDMNRDSAQGVHHSITPDDGHTISRSGAGTSGPRTSSGDADLQRPSEKRDAGNPPAENKKDRMEGTLDSDINGEKVNGIAGVIPISGNAGPTTTKTFDPHATVDGGNHYNKNNGSSIPSGHRNGDTKHSQDSCIHSSDLGSSSYNSSGSGPVHNAEEPIDSQTPGKTSAGMTSEAEGTEPINYQRAV